MREVLLLVAAMGPIGEEMGCCCSDVYLWVCLNFK